MPTPRLSRAAVVVGLSTACGVACSSAIADEPVSLTNDADDRRHRVACVGDSITAGDGSSLWSTAYPARLQALLGPDYAVENDGHFGATMLMRGSIPFWTTPEKESSTSWASGGGDVVIMLGTNDSNADNWTMQSEFVDSCAALVDHYRATSSTTRVWLALPPPVAASACCSMHTNLEQGVIPLLEQCAGARNATTIDVHGALVDHLEWLDDGVHPNAAGAGQIARAVHSALARRPAIEIAVSSAPTQPCSLMLNAIPTPAYGGTERVRFYEHDRWLGERSAPPWTWVEHDVSPGIHEYSAEMVESGGRLARSRGVAVELRAPVEPLP